MTTQILWAAVALLALAGWSATLVAFTKQQLPQANALCNLLKADAAIDDRIRRVVAAFEEKASRLRSAPPPQKTPEQGKLDKLREQMESFFDQNGTGAEVGGDEQPMPADQIAEVIQA